MKRVHTRPHIYTYASNRPRVPSEELETTAVRERPRAPAPHPNTAAKKTI